MTAIGTALAVVLLVLALVRTCVRAAAVPGPDGPGAGGGPRFMRATGDLELLLALAVVVLMAPRVWDLLT